MQPAVDISQSADQNIVMPDELKLMASNLVTSTHQQREGKTIKNRSVLSNAANNQLHLYDLTEHLIKLTMFLVTIFCSQQQQPSLRVNCQSYHHTRRNHPQPNHQIFRHNELNHRNSDNHHQHHYQQPHLPHPHNRQLLNQIIKNNKNNIDFPTPNYYHADRRASNSAGGQSAAQQTPGDNGKVLVCYYTTRGQSAPYWPSDTSGYVIPAEQLVADNTPQTETGGGQMQQQQPLPLPSPIMELRQESGFAPIVSSSSSYDKFVGGPQKNGYVAQTQRSGGNQLNPDPQSYSYAKNQQQQLVFKSSLNAHQPILMMPNQSGKSSGPFPTPAMSNGNNGSKSNKYQDAISQLLSIDQQAASSQNSQPANILHQQQPSLVIADALPMSSNGGKQPVAVPSYSLVGNSELEPTNNGGGLIVGSSPAPDFAAMAGGYSGGNGNNGDNGPTGGFIINSSNDNNSLERNSSPSVLMMTTTTKQVLTDAAAASSPTPAPSHHHYHHHHHHQHPHNQHQQLVFPSAPPSLSRAFIVNPQSFNNNINNNNNEVLDTKSHLFISSANHRQHNSSNNNRYLNQHDQQQQQVVNADRQREKSLQLLASGSEQQLSPTMLQMHHSQQQQQHLAAGFSGAVSSAASVPLSSAGTSATAILQTQQQQLPTTQYTSTTSDGTGTVGNLNSYRNTQQQPFLPSANTNQLIVGNGQASSSASSSSSASTQKLPTSLSSSMSSGSSPKSPCQSGFNIDCPSSSKQSAGRASGTSAGGLSSSPVVAAASASSQQPLASSSQQQHQHMLQSSTGANSLSSALVSSPLSTMFDVFGAASQYLMRFKPSSLISPSSFMFNTIQSDHLHALKTSNMSLLGSLASGSSSSSLIPLPYVPASLLAQKAKSAQSSASLASSSSSSSLAGENSGAETSSTWSRFSLQNSNQRREDVCGRTIQTPQRRIIGGEGARYGEFPYQVHIKIAKHQCGGALVDRQSIVTAAHCVYHFITRAPVNKLQIVIGAYDIEDEQYQELPPQYFKVNKVKLHPNFRFSASHPDRYDIAILKLDKPVKYTDNVLPVCLPSKDIKYESLVGTVTGFGKTDPSLSNRYGTRLLQKVDVPIIENNECERWHRTRGIDLKIFPEMMCAGYEDGLKDACVGDSGGPLVVKTAVGSNGSFRWTLAGITSAGFGCAQSRQPGIYHRVSHTVDWILDNLD